MINVIGICGTKRSGKDTLANKIVEYNPKFKIFRFADALKVFCSEIFAIPVNYFYDDNLKESTLPKEIFMDDFLEKMSAVTGIEIKPMLKTALTYRHIAQYFGTEYVRNAQDNYWIEHVRKQILECNQPVIITDVRFSNEAKMINDFHNNILIRVIKSDVPQDNSHQSETESLQIKENITVKFDHGDFYKIDRTAAMLSTLSR